MTGIEEMTRRRDAWRERAEKAADEIRALRLTHERDEEALARQRASIENLNSALRTAQAEVAANLQWVRKLQKDVEDWKYNSKVLARAFMRGTPMRITPWMGPVSLCPIQHSAPRSCVEGCAHPGCAAHWHCDMCGAIKCHAGWWRVRLGPVPTH